MGSYIEGVLGPGERLEYRAKVSVWSMLPMFLGGLLLTPLCGVGIILWLAAPIRYVTTELGITNKKIIAKFGFIRRGTIELFLHKVESVQVHQSVFGRMLGYGSIVVCGAGSHAPVPGIADPLEFRRKFMEIQERNEEKRSEK
jgi:uncharacterized membrane protein YdbT with pleckstrin-like domain